MELTPPPVRQLPLEPLRPAEAPPTVPMPSPAPSAFTGAPRRHAPAATFPIERMTVDDVSIAYAQKVAVDHVSLPIRKGEVLALIGPSGCGKTTLLRSLNRLTELTRTASMTGQIALDGTDIMRFDPTALRRRVTMVFQQPNPFPMSVFDNVAYVLREQAKRRPRKADLNEKVREVLAHAGLLGEVEHDLSHPALRLSGGQQQRLCIARAVAIEPEVLLLDEPASALDPISTAKIEELIAELKEDYCIAIVTHNMQQAARTADYTAFMYLGKLIEFDETSVIFTHPSNRQTEDYITGRFG